MNELFIQLCIRVVVFLEPLALFFLFFFFLLLFSEFVHRTRIAMNISSKPPPLASTIVSMSGVCEDRGGCVVEGWSAADVVAVSTV